MFRLVVLLCFDICRFNSFHARMAGACTGSDCERAVHSEI